MRESHVRSAAALAGYGRRRTVAGLRVAPADGGEVRTAQKKYQWPPPVRSPGVGAGPGRYTNSAGGILYTLLLLRSHDAHTTPHQDGAGERTLLVSFANATPTRPSQHAHPQISIAVLRDIFERTLSNKAVVEQHLHRLSSQRRP